MNYEEEEEEQEYMKQVKDGNEKTQESVQNDGKFNTLQKKRGIEEGEETSGGGCM